MGGYRGIIAWCCVARLSVESRGWFRFVETEVGVVVEVEAASRVREQGSGGKLLWNPYPDPRIGVACLAAWRGVAMQRNEHTVRLKAQVRISLLQEINMQCFLYWLDVN